jgi:large subunit ribosomal protein L43
MVALRTGQILRGALKTKGANGASVFIPQCTKLVFEYCEAWATSFRTRTYIANNLSKVAAANPHVEMVLKHRPSKQPVVRGFYSQCHHFTCICLFSKSSLVNGRTKEICLKDYEVSTIAQKVQLLLDSSGAKIKPLKRRTIESMSESVRGIWSGMHSEQPFRI